MARTAAPLHIVWFKRDLRAFDHAPLAEAALAAAEGGAVVLPLYIVEPAMWGSPTASARQWRFVAGALEALCQELAEIGAPLVVREGQAVAVLSALQADRGIAALWSHEETGEAWSYVRDKAVAAWARSAGVPWHQRQLGGVVRRLTSRDGWAERWDREMLKAALPVPQGLAPHGVDPGRIPDAMDLGMPADPAAAIGATPEAGRALLHSFLTTRGEHYRREMSSPVTAYDACSRLSPHLAWGTLSTREVYQEAVAARGYHASRAYRQSIDSFIARLHWRCHFKQKFEDEPEIEHRCMHPVYDGLREPDHDEARLEAWLKGETGLPMVDACMRALRATGWLNFRMRAMVVSVAAYPLWLDWRRFGPGLGQLFTDFEPGIHWSQSQMQSGTTGINTLRIYNPVKQSKDHDPEGVFLRQWLPELAGVPAERIHEPWRMTEAEQRAAGCVIDRDYPRRLVDPVSAARTAREKVYARRRAEGFEEGKARVLKKHASRRRPRIEHPPKADRQTSFDF
ncbi:MAG: deoxyribodipyrimidine photo-lyase/cryptochrome family protein [Pseudomonadota bacterium]